jgi:hypothetical protein
VGGLFLNFLDLSLITLVWRKRPTFWEIDSQLCIWGTQFKSISNWEQHASWPKWYTVLQTNPDESQGLILKDCKIVFDQLPKKKMVLKLNYF